MTFITTQHSSNFKAFLDKIVSKIKEKKQPYLNLIYLLFAYESLIFFLHFLAYILDQVYTGRAFSLVSGKKRKHRDDCRLPRSESRKRKRSHFHGIHEG